MGTSTCLLSPSCVENQGKCTLWEGTAVCKCKNAGAVDGYYGNLCQHKCPCDKAGTLKCWTVTGNGRAAGECECKAGYTGAHCTLALPPAFKLVPATKEVKCNVGFMNKAFLWHTSFFYFVPKYLTGFQAIVVLTPNGRQGYIAPDERNRGSQRRTI